MKTFTLTDGSLAKLGENRDDNQKLIIDKETKQNYYWFHLSAFPSGHMILFSTKVTINLLKECYYICKIHSRYRNYKNIRVDCTKVKNLKKTKNIGEVEYRSNRKVIVLDFDSFIPPKQKTKYLKNIL